jgi:hypothetical protein
VPRFQVGSRVKIRNVICTPHTNKTGTIVKVVPHKRKIRTLDRYIVSLSDGTEINLWDIQVEPVNVSTQ